MELREKLANKIEILLKSHSKKNHNGDYIGPDAYCMEKAMHLLLDKDIELKDIETPNSEFYSGCYKKDGSELHDEIMSDFNSLTTKECSKCSKVIEISWACCPYCGNKE